MSNGTKHELSTDRCVMCQNFNKSVLFFQSFVDRFTCNLELEYRDDGVEFYALLPGPVLTNITTLKMGLLMRPTADVYVKSAFRYIGRGVFTIGYVPHIMMYWLAKLGEVFLPSVADNVTVKMFREWYEKKPGYKY